MVFLKSHCILSVDYWDGNGGNLPTCDGTSPDDLFPSVSQQLAKDGRQAFLSETGSGNESDCTRYMSSVMDQLAEGPWLGYTVSQLPHSKLNSGLIRCALLRMISHGPQSPLHCP